MDELLRLLDDARADERGSARQRERWLQRAAEEGASLLGTLVDLGERGTPVTVRTRAGRVHTGVVRLVARDFCVVGAEAGDVWLAAGAITTVRPRREEHPPVATGDRAAVDLLLVEALARVAPERPRLGLVLAGGETLAGELRAVGADVLTLQLSAEPGGRCYVSVDAVSEVLRSG